ncbi:hypothetical protein [Desulforamulus aeronauticus]|uniref:Uncharacterized protein n=1 Tax=Desulforamulus aeronauticus DSM 10349 TaxID=1121421 RepID=A0A1M6VBI4_9FIRM|nr:hypothetical protein [Desulforamulus aeronauticus]SHK78818.1 hypothetical protein SAMN02745123_03115 [Desulforamulus aeronauticus DSM 10349]
MSSTTILLLSDEISNLECVIEQVLSIRVEEELKKVPVNVLYKLQGNDRFLISEWRQFEDYSNDICKLTMPDGADIRILIREAYVETSRQLKNMFDKEGHLLPKVERIITENIRTVFFEVNKKVYAILYTTYSTSIKKIKQRLFNEDLQIEANNIDYSINGELFYWLLYIYEEKNRLIAERFEIEAIAGFLGNIADENHKIKGESVDTPSLLVTKAFVSKYHPFRALDVMLKYDDYRLNFAFNDLGECSLNSGCRIPNSTYDKEISSAIIIYAFIIPLLDKLFKNDKDWSSQKKKDFAKNVGIEVIKEIATFHGINLKDI